MSDLPDQIARGIERIRADRAHGAAWLARRAAELLARLTVDVSHAESGDRSAQLHQVRAGAVALAAARPSMAALANTAAAIWYAGSGAADAADLERRLAAMHAEARRLGVSWDGAVEAICQHVRTMLGPVICTLSRSGTMEAVLARLANVGDEDGGSQRLRRAIVSESRPGGEGVAAAEALARSGLTVTLVPDAAYGVFIGEASAVALGADSVRADGSLVNKVGSYPLALAAREAGVPVYALCETLKIAAPGFPLVLEALEWPEVAATLPRGVEARSVAFELVPARLMTGIVTEEGVLSVAQIAERARVAGEAMADLASLPR
jgi:translation initiation factor 2B subunit (eIF-2B alpha/beta/delta family)